MDINIILQKLVLLFIPIIFGFLCRKVGFFDKQANKYFAKLMTEITVPALLFSSITAEKSANKLPEIMIVLIASLLIFVGFSLLSILTPKVFFAKGREIGIYKFLTVFNNNAFMGFPVLVSILGAKALFYGAIYNIVNNIFAFTIGLYFIGQSAKVKTKFSFKKMINTVNISILVALIIFFVRIPLPDIITSSTKMVGDITTPLSMIILGVSLAEVRFIELFTDYKLYIFSVLKMIVFPIIIWFILKRFVTGMDLLLNSIIIISAMPGAAICVTLATQYEANPQFASKYVLLSTLLSLITIPLVIYITT